jgi:selenocysteine-specific elongation factor
MESLRTRLPYEVSARAFRAILDRIGREAEIVREDSLLRLKSHKVKLGGDAGELGARVEAALTRAEFQPPDLKQLAEQLGLAPGAAAAQLRTVLAAMEHEGRVVKIATELYFDRTAVDAARTRLLDYLGTHTEITAAIYRDLLGASRKFAIALLDYFDHSGVTTRVGDQRRLRARAG